MDNNIKPAQLYNESSKKRKLNDLFGDVEGCSTEELNRLKKEVEKINKTFTDEEIEQLKRVLINKMDERITLAKEKTVAMNYPLLFKQFSSEELEKRPPLLFHNFTKKEKAFTTLYQWPIFTNVIEPFFKPIHFRIFNKKLPPHESYNENLALDNKKQIQDSIIASHFCPLKKITCSQLIGSIECQLQGIIMECILFGNVLCFVMEWLNTAPFLFIIAFKMNLKLTPEEETNTGIQKTIEKISKEHQILSRQDLLDDDSIKNSTVNDKKVTFNMKWLRSVVRDASLSYIYYAYAKKQ